METREQIPKSSWAVLVSCIKFIWRKCRTEPCHRSYNADSVNVNSNLFQDTYIVTQSSILLRIAYMKRKPQIIAYFL